MKRSLMFLAALMSFTIISCAGSQTVPQEPDLLQPARKELHKGTGWYQKGCYHKALTHLSGAHELFTALDDLPGIAMSLNNIGNVYGRTGDTESAILFFESSHAIYRDLDDHNGAVLALSNKAAMMIQNNDLEDAEATLDAAQKLVDRTSGKKHAALLKNRGVLLAGKKKYPEAEALLMEALAVSDPQNNAEAAAIHFSLGNLMAENNRYDEGIAHYRKALSFDRQSGFHAGIADDHAPGLEQDLQVELLHATFKDPE